MSAEPPKSDWGDEVVPGVFIIKRGGNPFNHPALAAPMEGFDLKKIYDKIDECEDLIQKLMKSNRELVDFFLPKNQDDDEAEDEQNEDDDNNENNHDWGSDAALGGGGISSNHVDPTQNSSTSNNASEITSMDAMLALAAAEAERCLAQDEQDHRKTQKGKSFAGDVAPPPSLLDKLPQDIKDAILENIDIIADQRKQQKELLEFTAVRQHKCGAHRVHGSAANNETAEEEHHHHDHD